MASAKKLATEGFNICVVHRDMRALAQQAQPHFEQIEKTGVKFKSFNVNALDDAGRTRILDELSDGMNGGKVKLLLHAISRGTLKKLVESKAGETKRDEVDDPEIGEHFNKINELFRSYSSDLGVLTQEDLKLSIHAMGTSMLDWSRDLVERSLFTAHGRIIGLTSEGNDRLWESYSAIAVAKSVLESLIKYLAVELAPYNITANVIQAGITDTFSFRMIPGNQMVKASTMFRNPYGRLTTPEDVADFIYLMCRKEANWVNGAIIPVDGGERLR